MITIIIPLFNKEAFVAEAVQSVLDQSFQSFELIIVNDGSTDNSLQQAKAIQDDRIRLCSIKKAGVSVARNTGIHDSRYEWIAFLDADDWWDNTFLEEMVGAIKQYPGHKLFASGRTHVFSNNRKRYQNKFLPAEGKTDRVNFFKVISRFLPLINSSNAVIQKSHLFTNGLFRENQKMHEDHDLWMRLCIGEEVIFCNKNLSFYRNTETDSASNLHYAAADFCIFLKTLVATKGRIGRDEKRYFAKYCNRFVLLTYIKNYSRYSSTEDKEVINFAQKLLTGKNKLLFNFLVVLPYKNTYPLFKFLQFK